MEIDEILNKHQNSPTIFQNTHPTIPVRIKAIQAFSESSLFENYFNSEPMVEVDSVLTEKMAVLIRTIELNPRNEQEYYRTILLASGCVLISGVDGSVNELEDERIVEYLSNYVMYPREFIRSVLSEVKTREDIFNIMLDAVSKLLKIDPSEREKIFFYLCHVIFSDRKITKQEIEFLFSIGTNTLGFHEIEINKKFIEAMTIVKFNPIY